MKIEVDDTFFGTELVDLALQNNFFQDLMEVIGSKFTKPIKIFSNYVQYPSKRKG